MPSTNITSAAPRNGRKPDRAATEGALMEAALRLLERDGVLAGLNMQEVADEAGVNRGLIHHYFGSRRALLRAALDWGVQQTVAEYERSRNRPTEDKGPRQFFGYLEDGTFARLIALLALDGDDSFDPIPFAKERIADDERARDESNFYAGDVDIPAMLVVWESALAGYSIIRRAAARQLGIQVRSLDRRVLDMLGRQSHALRGTSTEDGPLTASTPSR